MEEDYLVHYGVLGMKWGVRKDGKPQGFQYGKKLRRNVKRRANQASKRRKAMAKRRNVNRNRYSLSEKELDARIARLEKEKRLRELTESEVSPGRKYVKDFLKENGKKIAGGVAVGIGSYAVTVALNGGRFNPVEAAKWIANPAKKKK